MQEDGHTFTISPSTNIITLKKSSFKFQVLLEHIEGVYLFASFSDSLYRLGDNDSIPGFTRLPEMTMTEVEYNKEKELMINNEGWSYWYYNPALPSHRFNKKIVLLDDDRVVGFKSVKQLYFLPERKERKIKEINQPLYLFFVAADTDEAGKPVKELLRRKVKIEWKNED
jgi:hypothetical protein